MFVPHWLVMCVQCLLFITSVYNYKGQALLQLYSGYVMYYKPGLKHYYYYFHVCSNKYYCLLKKKEKENMDVYPILVVCVQCSLFITPIYNYKGQALLQLYFDYVMYYKLGLKHYYYYFCVFSNKYYSPYMIAFTFSHIVCYQLPNYISSHRIFLY